MAAEAKTAQVNLRLQPALKQAAEFAAEKDHRSLTSLIEKLLSEYLAEQKPSLENWHQAACERLQSFLMTRSPGSSSDRGFLARSYALIDPTGYRIEPHKLEPILRATHASLGRLVPTPRIIYPYTKSEIAAHFTADENLNTGHNEEVLECIVQQDVIPTIELWRVSPSGFATDIRPHAEDRARVGQSPSEPGQFFFPYYLMRHLAEIVLHAKIFGENFPHAQRIEFRCEWWGLLGREIADFDPMVMLTWTAGLKSHQDRRVTTAKCSVADLANAWPEIVSQLGGPVARLFHPTFDFSPDWVRAQIPRFRR